MQRAQRLVLAALSLALTTPVTAETASQVFQKVSPSIVVVVTYDAAGKPTEQGSGVMLPNHDVATNCHVLKDGTRYRVSYRNKDYPARLDKSDWSRDVCSLNVPSLPAPPVVLGNTKTLHVGAPVYAIGTPEGLQLTLSEGIVSSLRPVGGGSYIQTTAAISPGSSGGGLFDDEGHLLGLTSFFMSQGQQLNFALPVEWIEALPQRSAQRIAQHINDVDWLNRAMALEKKKDWGDLLRFSDRWLKASPGNSLALAVAGEAYYGAGQYSQAIRAYRQVLQINPQYAEAWDNLGIAYGDLGQNLQAIDADRHALQINPQYADAWYSLGIAYDNSGQYSQAIDADRHALQINPQDAVAWYNLGIAYAHAGKYSQAIDAYLHAVRINPQGEHYWNNLGNVYKQVGQPSQAINAYLQDLKIHPQDAEAWYNLGIIYTRPGQYLQAIDAFRQAVRINPREDHYWYNLGTVYRQAGQYPQAIDAFRQALQINPQGARAWNNLAGAYSHLGQRSQAIEAYGRALKINPQDADTWYNLAIVYGQAEQYPQAIDAFRRDLQINSKDAEAWYALGSIYVGEGQDVHARAAYQHLKTLSPGLAQKLFDLIVNK